MLCLQRLIITFRPAGILDGTDSHTLCFQIDERINLSQFVPKKCTDCYLDLRKRLKQADSQLPIVLIKLHNIGKSKILSKTLLILI